MSYNARGDAGTFGPNAAVEIPNGAGQSLISNLQTYEAVGIFGAAGGTVFPATLLASTTYTLFIAPPNPSAASGLLPLGNSYRIAGGSFFYSAAAAGAATMALEICPAGTANGAGNNPLSTATVALNTAPSNTPTNLTLGTNIDNQIILPGGRINLVIGATSTASLADFTIVLYLIRTA